MSKAHTLKLEDSLESINQAIAQGNTGGAWYYTKYTDTNKALVLSKKAVGVLQGAGVNLQKAYISYNATPLVFTAIEKVLNANGDIFTKREDR